MRLKDNGDSLTIWLSARDTYEWAHRPGAAWPCSTLADKRVCASFDAHGLVESTVNGRWDNECDGHEFNAVIADHAKTRLPKDHPCYFVVVEQFE